MAKPTLELFDSRARFRMPEPAALDALDPATRKRFDAVRTAALAAEAATAGTKEATEHVAACVAEVRAAEENLRVVMPPVDAVTAARQWMQSQR